MRGLKNKMKKATLIYYHILHYQPENIKLLNENFAVISLPDPLHDTADVLKRADVVLVPLGYYFGREKIDTASRLKVIGSNTTGQPHIDAAYAAQKGIEVITLKDCKDFLRTITPTAELTWGLLIALTRNMIPAYRSVLEGSWNRKPFGGPAMLPRMSLGVVGYGRLGQMVASYGRCFGMTVRYYDPFVDGHSLDIERVPSLKELVKISDIITIHVPHIKDTERLFNKEVFANFKKGSYLINTARGEVVDHDELLHSLRSGVLAGAAIDVFEGEFEPGFENHLKGHPLLAYAKAHTNLIITPHIGGSTIDAWRLTEEHVINLMIAHIKAMHRGRSRCND